MELPVLSVSQFVDLVNQTLEAAYPVVVVEGEISGFEDKRHIYFTLRDETSSVRCFMWSGTLNQPIEDGMNVLITGRPRLHSQYGFTINVEKVEPAGEGALRRAFEISKAKLSAEGLFDVAHKRPIPKFPSRIGLITAAGSAAYRDFVGKVGERWGGIEILTADVQVQGATSVDQIVSAIDYFNQLAKLPDVLVIVRGGGSLEDLKAFNEELVARAIHTSRTPTVVGVGHKKDVTLAELVADVEAATPTEAAEWVVPDKAVISRRIDDYAALINRAPLRAITNIEAEIHHHVGVMYRFVPGLAEKTEHSQARILAGWKLTAERLGGHLARLEGTLHHLDPRQILARGYAVARLHSEVVRSVKQVSIGDRIMLQLAKGSIDAQVKHVKDTPRKS